MELYDIMILILGGLIFIGGTGFGIWYMVFLKTK